VRAIVALGRLGIVPEKIPQRLPHLTRPQVFDVLKDCLKRWFASVTRHAGCPDTPDSAPGVPALAGVWPEPAEAGTPAPGPYPYDKPFSDSF